ncbi:hypothetical protein AMTRI_Chr06g179470 [Amborella trichopoda]
MLSLLWITRSIMLQIAMLIRLAGMEGFNVFEDLEYVTFLDIHSGRCWRDCWWFHFNLFTFCLGGYREQTK